MREFVQQLINGLSWGAIYALIAVGYTMVYGVLRLINFAHGDVYMIGAMTGVYIGAGGLYFYLESHPRLAMLVVATLGSAFLSLHLLALGLRLRDNWVRTLVEGARYVLAALLVAAAGAMVGSLLVRRAGVPSWTALLVTLVTAMVVCGALGLLIEFVAYRPLRNQPRITSLITAIGVSMLLEYGGQGVFGATPKAFPNVAPLSEYSINVRGVSVSPVDVMIVVVTLVLMAVLTWIVLKTRVGMALRAVSYRFDTAALMGININRIISFTFVLGSVLAAAAGILVAVRSPVVDPLMGLMPGIKAFVAAVLGGIGSIPGAVAGGLVLGLTEVLVAGYLPEGSQYKDGIAFVILIGILLVKPTGLFGRNLVEKV